MKKLFFLVSIILLVAASCNQAAKNSQQQTDEQDQQASSSDVNLPQGNKTGWETYANSQYGFTVQYPKNEYKLYTDYNQTQNLSFIPVCDSTMVGCLFYSKEAYKNTNFEGAGLSFNVLKSLTTASQCQTAEGAAGVPQVVNGETFYMFGGSGAATGHASQYENFRIFKNNNCLEISLKVTSATVNAPDRGTAKEFNQNEVLNKLKQVSSTFKFTDTASQAGPMPKMTYKVTSSRCAQNNEYANVALYADGKQVTIYKSTICDINKVVFRAGNSQVVYFSIEPSGLGGYYSFQPAFNLYKLDLAKKSVAKLETGDYWIGGLDFNKDLTKVIYAPFEKATQGVVLMDLASGAKQALKPVPATGSQRAQVGNVKLSPDATKAAIAVAYGPDNEYGEIYILDLSANSYTLYKKSDSSHLQVNGWKSNGEVNWSAIK